MAPTNAFGQPVGFPVPGWTPRPRPARARMEGRFCRLEPFDPAHHTEPLRAADVADDPDGRSYTYLPYGPFPTLDAYRAWITKTCLGDDPLFFAIVDQTTAAPLGIASYLRIDPPVGSVEVGHLHFSPRLQRTPHATEAMFLMMRHVFELGYRRCEWKCDALNAPSRAAAQRFGFSFEGIFRQAWVVKNRNRDTAWYAAIDREWPALKAAYTTWLDPANFDAEGRQHTRLSDLTAPILVRRDG